MSQRRLMLVAALCSAVFAASAGAVDRNQNSVMDTGDRGLTTPSAVDQVLTPEPRVPAGQPARPRAGNPMSPSESHPAMVRESQPPITRGDNRNLPNPATPSAANESAPQPQATVREPTNATGMEGRPPVGATR
jgi:hypothetical protein